MRSHDPTAAARAFVAAGRPPDDPANVARAAVREDLRRSPTRDGVAGRGPRRRRCDRLNVVRGHAARPGARRGGGARRVRPAIAPIRALGPDRRLVTADRAPADLAADRRRGRSRRRSSSAAPSRRRSLPGRDPPGLEGPPPLARAPATHRGHRRGRAGASWPPGRAAPARHRRRPHPGGTGRRGRTSPRPPRSPARCRSRWPAA